MELKGYEQSVGVNEYLHEGMSEQAVDADLTLPDYCPDVQRILKCMLCPRVQSVQTAGDRVTADGSALVRVVYVSDSGKVCSYEQSYPFSKYAEVKALDAACCASVRATVSYVNCRAVSQRRVDVHGMLNLSFQVKRKRDERFLCGAQGGGVQMKTKVKRVMSVIGDTERAFPLSEVTELEASLPPVGQLLHTTGIALLEDVKAIRNKLLIKGELEVRVLYIADTAQAEVTKFSHYIPISQIIEMEGVDEESESRIALHVAALDVLPKADGNGETRLLDISARVCALVEAGQEVELPLIVDAYSTEGDLKLDYQNAQTRTLAQRCKDSFVTKHTLDLPDIQQILAVWCGDAQANAAATEDALAVQGTVLAHILYLDAQSQPTYAERPVDFQYKRPLEGRPERLQCEPQLFVLANGWSIDANGAAELKIELQVNFTAYALETNRVVSAMEATQSNAAREETPICIYFADTDESVWDIARRYNTTVEAVQRENNIGEKINEACMLLITKN